MNDSILIIGGGHAAAQLCVALAEAGLATHVKLVSAESSLPYHRPPLSKAYLKGTGDAAQHHKPEAWYGEAGIGVHLHDAVLSIDTGARTATLKSGAVLPWAKLVLATGTRPRLLAAVDMSLANVAVLRDLEHAAQLRGQLAAAQHVVIIGGGFIGLEVAATAKGMGKNVTVLEAGTRLLGRGASEALSAHVLDVHRAAGIDVRLAARDWTLASEGGRVTAITEGGDTVPVDLLLVGVGAEPETTLAQAAGIACDDGVVVDGCMRTSHPDVLAIGDCTRFPDVRTGRVLRLESVQNANDQARTAAATLAGTPRPHNALATFWSEQGALRLQVAGLLPPATDGAVTTVRRPGPTDAAFSLFHYVDGKLQCAESVNAPMDHMMSRKLLDAGVSPSPEAIADATVPLKNLMG